MNIDELLALLEQLKNDGWFKSSSRNKKKALHVRNGNSDILICLKGFCMAHVYLNSGTGYYRLIYSMKMGLKHSFINNFGADATFQANKFEGLIIFDSQGPINYMTPNIMLGFHQLTTAD